MAHKYTSSGSVYYRIGLTSSEVGSPAIDFIIDEAERELELQTGRNWTSGTAQTVTELYDGAKKDMFDNKSTSLILNNYPILAVGSLQILNTDGSVSDSISGLSATQIAAGSTQSTEFWLDKDVGKISLISKEFTPGTRNIKVYYTYGYNTVPQEIATLAECITGIKAWIQFLGGKYNWLNNYSIPETSASKGDLYQRGMQMIELLTQEAQRLYDRIGLRSRTLAYFSRGSV